MIDLNDIKDYMLDNTMITNNLLKIEEKDVILQKKVIEKSLKKSIYYPKEKDSLFWCFYIIKYGYEKYELLFHKNEVIEKQIKVEYVEKLRKEKALVKIYKFDTLTNIESNLVNDKYLQLPAFLTLCAIENINILFLNKTKKTYYEFTIDETKDKYIIYLNEEKYEKRYGFELNAYDIEKINKIKEINYCIENLKKPIKAITSYTMQDLTTIANKLSIELNKDAKKKLKKDLYEDIIKHFA